jgi:hypothetical protein
MITLPLLLLPLRLFSQVQKPAGVQGLPQLPRRVVVQVRVFGKAPLPPQTPTRVEVVSCQETIFS